MKLTKYFLSIAAAVGMISGCQKQELAQICAPEDAVAPVIEAVQDVVFTAENVASDTLTISWAPLQYGVNVEINYTVEASVAGGKPVVIAKNIKKPAFVSPYEEINAILNYTEGLDLVAGEATEVSLRVSGQFSDYAPVYSEYVTAKFTVVDAVPAVMKPYEDAITINADNLATGKTKFGWKPAKYGKNIAIEYSVAVGLVDGDKKIAIATGVKNPAEGSTDFEAEVKFSDINGAVLYDLMVPADRAVDVAYYVGAKIGEYATVYSEPVMITTTATAAKKEYKKLTIVGSYQGWKPGIGQYVFDFGGEDKAYSGMIDFCADPTFDISKLEFKVVGTAWGDQECSVESGAAQTEEADLLTLVNGGGDNIKAYGAKRFYHFTFTKDASAPTLKKNLSFDKIGVIGANGDWNNDIVMTFYAPTQTFYADVEFASDTEFKFRLDGAWAKDWGVTDGAVVAGGGNIPAKAGNYRVYFNLNNLDEITYELNAFMYGQDESAGEPEPEPDPEPETPALVGWGLVGEFSGWADGKDLMLASDGTYLVAKGVELSGQFKFRKDGSWGTNLGATGEVEPFELTANSETELVANGKNFTIAAGTYDIYLDEANAKAWFINDGSYPGGGAAPVASEWGIIGVAGDWSNNVTMYEAGDYIVAKGVKFSDNNEFKFRKGNTWGTELVYEGVVSPDAEYACAAGGGNSKLVQGGTYDVYLAATLDKFYIMTPGKTPAEAGEAQKMYTDPSADSFVVGFSGSAIGWDDPSFGTNDRAAFVSKNVTDAATFAGTYEFKLEGFAVAENDAFKVRINGQWIGVGQATIEGLTVSGEGDFIAGESGTYTAVITFAWDGNSSSDVKVVFSK